MKQIFLIGVALFWATSAIAHSPLKVTEPANETTISAVPNEVSLGFKGGIRLTRVTVTHADNDTQDLDLSGFSGFISEYSIPMNSQGAGLYVIEWRGLGDDGHALNGSFSFTVAE